MVLVTVVCTAILAAERVRVARLPARPGSPARCSARGALDNLLLFVATLAVLVLFHKHEPVPFNNYAYLAKALLRGRLDLPDLPRSYEHITFNGRVYLHVPPGPVIFVLPFVALFGLDFDIGLLSLILGALNGVLFHQTLRVLGLTGRRARLWLTALFTLGTVHFYLAAVGYSWFLAQLGGTFFTLLALRLLFDDKRPGSRRDALLIGLLFALAVTCRLSLMVLVLFFLLCLGRTGRFGWRAVPFFAAGAFIPGALYMLYNQARFQTVLDIGYLLFHRLDSPTGGPAGLRYIPFNLYSLFVMAPVWMDKFPHIEPLTMQGVSLTFTSPALYFAVNAREPRRLVRLLWVAVLTGAIPFLVNCTNGFPQFGMRYAMDFIPFLALLTALALRDLTFRHKVLIIFCIWVNAWGTLHWNFFR